MFRFPRPLAVSLSHLVALPKAPQRPHRLASGPRDAPLVRPWWFERSSHCVSSIAIANLMTKPVTLLMEVMRSMAFIASFSSVGL
jgi:hypothetical protein